MSLVDELRKLADDWHLEDNHKKDFDFWLRGEAVLRRAADELEKLAELRASNPHVIANDYMRRMYRAETELTLLKFAAQAACDDNDLKCEDASGNLDRLREALSSISASE